MNILKTVILIAISMNTAYAFQETTNQIEDDIIIINPNDLKKIKTNKQKSEDTNAIENINPQADKKVNSIDTTKRELETKATQKRDINKLLKQNLAMKDSIKNKIDVNLSEITNFNLFYTEFFKDLKFELNIPENLKFHTSKLIALQLSDKTMNKNKVELLSSGTRSYNNDTFYLIKDHSIVKRLGSIFINLKLINNEVEYDIDNNQIFNVFLIDSINNRNKQSQELNHLIDSEVFSDICFIAFRNRDLNSITSKELQIKNVEVATENIRFKLSTSSISSNTSDENRLNQLITTRKAFRGTNHYASNVGPQHTKALNIASDYVYNGAYHRTHNTSIAFIRLNFTDSAPIRSATCYARSPDDLLNNVLDSLANSFRIR